MSADVQRLASGQAPVPITPKVAAATAPKTTPVPPPSPAGIVIPEAPSGMGRKLVFAGLGAVVLVIVIYAILSLFGGGEPSPTATPTAEPTAAPTLRPTTKNLDSYFGQSVKTLVAPDPGDPFAWQREVDLLATTRDVAIQIGTQTEDPVRHPTYPLLNRIVPGFTAGASFDGERAVLVFGQSERFDPSDGTPLSGGGIGARVILILEVSDAASANQAMRAWEQGDESGDLISDLSAVLMHGKEPLVQTFSDATYRQVPVRYLNFPYADDSVDWAIVPASNGKNYLVISGSRQSLFFAIDQLLK